MKTIGLIISAAVMAASFAASAQSIAVKSVHKVEVDGTAFHPELADGGRTLLLTSENYTGLRAVNLETRKVQTISTAKKAGYNPRLSTVSKIRSMFAASRVSAQSKDCKIVVSNGGSETALTPNGEEYSYIWPSVSPDGTRIAYTVCGRGSFVCNLDGSEVVSLGELRAPRWVDDMWIVGMVDHGNMMTTDSAIFAVKADGTGRTRLTPEGQIAMFPSTCGNMVAFEADGGEIYLMELSVE